MDYAIQLLLPIMGGLFLGLWLQENWGASPLWTVVLAILGMVAGIGIMYKRLMYPSQPDSEAAPKPPSPRKNQPKEEETDDDDTPWNP